ncbi:MAG: molybdopterin-dependent oxidoreductase [Phycisphaerae bacterium]
MPDNKSSSTDLPRITSEDTKRTDRIPPGQTETENWPVLHYGGIPAIDPAVWQLRIDGLVEEPWSCDLETFQALPRIEVFCDIHCVTTWSRLNNVFEGPSTKTVLSHVRPRPEARHVILHACEGSGGPWSTNLSIDDFLDDDCLFALLHDGRPLTPHHGGPVRVVVPKLYFWKSAKWINRVELIADDQPGFWERNGYHIHGDPWKEERFSD